MEDKYRKGDYNNGKGFLVENTPEGPMYKINEMWVSPLAYRAAKTLAHNWGVSEKVALSKMLEQYAATNCKIEDRFDLYKNDVLPKLIEKAKSRNGCKETQSCQR